MAITNEKEFWVNREKKLWKTLQSDPNNLMLKKLHEEARLKVDLQSDPNNRGLKNLLKEVSKDPSLHMDEQGKKGKRVKVWIIKFGVAMLLGAITSFFISGLNNNPREFSLEGTILWGASFCILIFGWKTFLGLNKKNYSSASESIQHNSKVSRRGWTEIEKRTVRESQDGRCKKCKEVPPRWEYHHKDGDRSNNSLSNCEGLCPNCHSIKTHE